MKYSAVVYFLWRRRFKKRKQKIKFRISVDSEKIILLENPKNLTIILLSQHSRYNSQSSLIKKFLSAATSHVAQWSDLGARRKIDKISISSKFFIALLALCTHESVRYGFVNKSLDSNLRIKLLKLLLVSYEFSLEQFTMNFRLKGRKKSKPRRSFVYSHATDNIISLYSQFSDSLAWWKIKNALDASICCQQRRQSLCFVDWKCSLARIPVSWTRIQEANGSSSFHLGYRKWPSGLRSRPFPRRSDSSLRNFLREWALVSSWGLEPVTAADWSTAILFGRRIDWPWYSKHSFAIDGVAGKIRHNFR